MKKIRSNPLTNIFQLFCVMLALGTLSASFAQTTEMLHSTPPSPARDNYTGGLGCLFQTGSSNAIVSHLGVYDTNGDGLMISHDAGLFTSGGTMLATVTVPAGTAAYFTNGFRWVALDPPVLLSSNTSYIVASLVTTSDGDFWQDAFSPTWNTFFIGSTATTTRHAMYGPGGSTAWPPAGFTQNGNNNTYGNVSLAYIEIDTARVGVQTTNVSFSAGQTLAVRGFASGQAPITYQWYKAPNMPLTDQTNALLTIPNSATTDSGTYFLTATNGIGGSQSSNVTVLVTSFPVGISQQPTNLTVFANYPAAFSLVATGSPPISYQWTRNGNPITGATTNKFSISSASLTNDGDVYACVVSNFTSGISYVVTSSDATLTVVPNQALPQQFLHGRGNNLTTNSFSGLVGGEFKVGNTPALVTHLGYYATQFTDANKTNATLTSAHHVGIFSTDGKVLYGSVIVPAGVNPVINGYMWTQLDPPLVLATNTTYLLVAETFAGVDPWGNSYVVTDWNTYFAGPTPTTTSFATFWGAAWPNAGASGLYAGQMYSAPNMAILALPTAIAAVSPTNITQYAQLNTTLTAQVSGEAPLTIQWYKAPSTLLTGQTNLTLNLNNLSAGDSGDYYVIATNPNGSVQSSNATVTVLPDAGPSVDQDIQSVALFLHQSYQFTTAVSGTPPFTYQWTFDGNPITDATNASLKLRDASSALAGDYQLLITNNYGFATSAIANVSVVSPPAGSYPAAIMGTNLLAYYRFSDVASGAGIATNQGSLGLSVNGLYEGNYAAGTGPSGSHFEADNAAVALDGLTSDVMIPPLGVTVSNVTIAAWIYKAVPAEGSDTAIYYHRGANVFGLSVTPDPTSGADTLRYTWNGSFSFATGLILPTNKWALVTMVITPTKASLYLQDDTGLRSTNNTAAHPSATFSATNYVGWDTAGGLLARRWNGMIDELMIFNRALSPSEVNALYLGVPGNVTLSILPSGNNVVVTWSSGTLLEATNITGPWSTNSTATSPYTAPLDSTQKFYRVQIP
jgi:hypothetical protein